MSGSETQGAINDSTGIMDETVIGPYEYAGSLKALGFKADPIILSKFLQAYLQNQVNGSGYEFSLANPETPIVYMLISDAIMQGSLRKGVYRIRSCQFHIPVICSDDEGNAEAGSLQVFSYGSNMQNALTSTEVRGPYMSHCSIRVRSLAEDLDSAASAQTLFELSPQVITPDLSLKNACLLSLDKIEQPYALPAAGCADDSLSFDPAVVFALKQFQHERWPGGACYQSLVKIDYTLEDTWAAKLATNVEDYVNVHWHQGNEKLAGLRLNIRRYEYHPIVSALGLLVDQSRVCQEENGKIACDMLMPVSYLSMGSKNDALRMPVTEKLGETLCYRSRVRNDETQGWERLN